MLKVGVLVILNLIFVWNPNTVNTRTIAKCYKSDLHSVIVNTTTGLIKASCEHHKLHDDNVSRGANVYSWLGIPYAEPPIGNKRFEPPIPVKPWKHVLDGTKWANSCMQNSYTSKAKNEFIGYNMWKPNIITYSEDCLYLNIWARADKFIRRNSKFGSNEPSPILVFISGDDLTSGTSALDIYDPSAFVTLTGLIVVTINYRLGIFGHLHLKGHINGNQALLDQHLALKWIYENAENFGGDPTRITLLGFGTGGSTLAGYHLLYKPSWPFFHNIILQSTTLLQSSLTPITSNEATKRALKFADYIRCDKVKTDEIVDCLKKMDSFDLSSIAKSYFSNHVLKRNIRSKMYIMTYFPPVIDGSIIKDIPAKSFTENNYKKCSILMGYNKNEANMRIDRFEDTLNEPRVYDLRGLENFVDKYFYYYPYYSLRSNETIIQKIVNEYTKHIKNKNYRMNYLVILDRIITHESFSCPVLKLAENYRSTNNAYVYSYSHRVTTSPWNIDYDVAHGDELAMIFGHVLRKSHNSISNNPWIQPNTYTNEERDLCFKMINYWSNFISNDNPNVGGEFSMFDTKEEWPSYGFNSSKGNILNFKTHKLDLAKNPIHERCKFWNNLLF